jgi:hypothetical protein
MKNIFQLKKNLVWLLKKYFPSILEGKHFPEIVKNIKISYYLLIIINLILKLLIAIYFILNFFCSTHPLKFDLI